MRESDYEHPVYFKLRSKLKLWHAYFIQFNAKKINETFSDHIVILN